MGISTILGNGVLGGWSLRSPLSSDAEEFVDSSSSGLATAPTNPTWLNVMNHQTMKKPRQTASSCNLCSRDRHYSPSTVMNGTTTIPSRQRLAQVLVPSVSTGRHSSHSVPLRSIMDPSSRNTTNERLAEANDRRYISQPPVSV